MQTLIIQGESGFLEQVRAVAGALANLSKQDVKIDTIDVSYLTELSSRADDALDGTGFISEEEGLKAIQSIKNGSFKS
ncbi:hypothetical protein [Campylobacter majalis]|uniref:hypothetical protein n=1 Tax=Campylobacter majalis TaxID=2790656 RepID=UPI003D696EB7